MEDLAQRLRQDVRITVAVALGALLICAWIGWAIYVTSDRGADAGLGVVIAWPALLVALTLIALPFVAIYLLLRRLSESRDEPSATAADSVPSDGNDEEEEEDGEAEGEDAEKDTDEEEDDDKDEAGEDESEAEEEEEDDSTDDDEDKSEDEEEEKDEPKAKTSSKKKSSKPKKKASKA